MRRAFLPLIPTLVALLSVPLPAAAQNPKLLGSFSAWDAFSYTEKGAPVCYVVSSPQDREPKNVRRGDVYVMVTHRPAAKVSGEVSVVAGYPYKKDSEVTVAIGADKHVLFTAGENAWAREVKDDQALVRAMIRGVTMIVRGTSGRGTLTADTYSLSGFTAAHEAIGVACKVK
jgi:hypothetical protein